MIFEKEDLKAEEIVDLEFKCDWCRRIHKIDIKKIVYSPVAGIGEFIKKNFKNDTGILILCDEITWEVAGRKIYSNLNFSKKKSLILKPKKEKRVTAKYEYLKEIEKCLKDINLILTVGTGTITDLGKIIGDKYKICVFSFPTAPSMNGFTSPVAAYIKNGVKITIPVSPCKYVYIDEDIISEAPIELIKSGFSDSLAKGFANADWKISSIILGEYFCILPLKILSNAEKKYIDKGELVRKRDKKIIMDIMECLNLGGISMIIAGSSSPASGGEHLISHFLDMYSHQNNLQPFSYHGLQVGTGVFISSLIYENLKRFDVYDVSKRLKERKIDYDERLKKLISLFPSSKKSLKEIFKKKIELMNLIKGKITEKWDGIKKEAFPIVYKPEQIKNFLEKCGCVFHLKEICNDEKLIYETIKNSRFIRERLTILDIADEIGLIDDLIEEYMEMK